MKKAFFALTVALCAGFASAVVADGWTCLTYTSGNQNIDTGLDIAIGESGTYALVFTPSSTIATYRYITMFGAQTDGAATTEATAGSTRARIVLRTGDSSATEILGSIDVSGASGAGTFVDFTSVGSITTGTENVMAIAIQRGSASGETTTVTITLNGEVTTFTFTETDDTAAYTYQIASIAQNYGGGSTLDMDDNYTVWTMASVATAEEIATLPEPTVLALLALGVAGMALKRKVA